MIQHIFSDIVSSGFFLMPLYNLLKNNIRVWLLYFILQSDKYLFEERCS